MTEPSSPRRRPGGHKKRRAILEAASAVLSTEPAQQGTEGQERPKGAEATAPASLVSAAVQLAARITAERVEAERLSREADATVRAKREAERSEADAAIAACLARARGWDVPRLRHALSLLASGRPYDIACRVAGGNPDALRSLAQRCPELHDAIECARAQGWTALHEAVLAGGDRDEWKRHAWLLERLAPRLYAPPKVVEVQGSASAPPVRVALSLDQAVKLASELEEGEGG